ncbi:hypothetical protein [Longimicrobium sp.]|uniref:hypothetical protein n=1 Tax=Longimicrobium sp. TaxID=2029185 RepID=UPI003B3A6F14
MDTHTGRGWPWACLAILAALLAAVPAAAQPGDYGRRADSLEIATDAEPLPADSADTACDPFGMRVVRDSADARALEGFRGCGPGAFPSLGRRLYVHVRLGGDCHASHDVHAYRSAARREYRIAVTTWYGGCRAAHYGSRWITLPPLPDGWTVAFTEVKGDRRWQGWSLDTLGAAADAEPLAIHPELAVECDPAGVRVLRDRADAREIRGLPGCQPSAFPALGRALYVRVVPGFCGGRHSVQAYRSEARREFRVVTVARSRGCGGRGDGPRWYRLPPLPAGWTVAFTDTAA